MAIGRKRPLALAAGIVAAMLLAGCAASQPVSVRYRKPTTSGTSGSTTTSTPSTISSDPAISTTVTSTPRPSPPPRLDDGSLGNEATRLACTLLGRDQIAAQFGGPVGPATPTYPYCQWLVGADAFLALAVEPHTSFRAATRFVVPLVTITGVGGHAMIADNRYLYFTSGTTSYWLLFQQVGDFSLLHESQLVSLAHDVLARGLRSSPVGLPPSVPPGPPIYFAGDSTAAGPEWAFVTFDATTPAMRTLAEYQVGSGLVVPQYFDWSRHLLAVVAARRPRLVIYMGSANDGQDLWYGGAYRAPGTAGWRRAYAERVGTIMSALTREGSKVLWIGEPAMQDPLLSAEMLAIDEVCAAQASANPGVTFFNPGNVLNGPGWTYRSTVVIDGGVVPARLDGLHLNMAGSIYLARYIAQYASRILGSSGTA